MIRLIIVDDHPIVRKGIKQIFEDRNDIVVKDETSNTQELLERLNKNNDFDIILLDISMPGRSGIDILNQLKQEYPRIKVLILSMYHEEQYAIRAIKAGACGYITKDSPPEELIRAIKKIINGEKYLSNSLAERVISEMISNQEKKIHESLSNREYEIMCMLAKGKSISEIADDLFISVKTVSTYRTRILEKMNIKSNSGITRYAIENNLI